MYSSELTLKDLNNAIEEIRNAVGWSRFVVVGNKDVIDVVTPYLDLKYGSVEIYNGLKEDTIYVIPGAAQNSTVDKFVIDEVFDKIYDTFMIPYRIAEADYEN